LYRERRDRPIQLGAPVAVVERCEEQWRGFARNARDGEHDARGDARAGGAQDHEKARPPERHTERERRLAQVARDEAEELFRRPRHGGDHHDREGNTARQGREALHCYHDERIDKNADRN
jgi:hypothetical protein